MCRVWFSQQVDKFVFQSGIRQVGFGVWSRPVWFESRVWALTILSFPDFSQFSRQKPMQYLEIGQDIFFPPQTFSSLQNAAFGTVF